MIIAYLRGKNRNFSISYQQTYIIKYALKNAIAIDLTEIDDDPLSQILEDRSNLLKILHSLEENDSILIYDLWVLSRKVGELAKIFDCILKNDISIYVCKQDLVLNKHTPLHVVINLLSNQREKNLQSDKLTMGRPKGSFSKSKFDIYKSDILQMLEASLSVSEISKRLHVSRSSLKDYINSRSLKEIVDSKNIPNITRINIQNNLPDTLNKECALKNQHKE